MYTIERTPGSIATANFIFDEDDDNFDIQLLFDESLLMSKTELQQREEEMSPEDAELEDLKAFERRLEEIIAAGRPRPYRWPLVLGTIFACTAISACHWLENVRESDSLVLQILASRGALAISLATIALMILYGVKQVTKRRYSGTRPADQARITLAVFQLNCDNEGRLVRVTPVIRDHTQRRPSPRNSRNFYFAD